MTVKLGMVAAIVLAALFLLAGLWNPLTGIPMALLFTAIAVGIHKRYAWRAFGGALLLAAMAATAMVSMARSGVAAPWGTLAVSLVILAVPALLLFRAGRAISGAQPRGAAPVWIAIAAVVFLFPQIMRPYVIASGSMENTVMTGDSLLIAPWVGAAPARGDVVQVRYPADPKQSFIKRVVAVGGDRVHMVNKALFVNGTAVDEPYAVHTTEYVDAFRDNFPQAPTIRLPMAGWQEWLEQNIHDGEIVVPAGKYFVLGDNRDNSLDSRYWGFVERQEILGKPVMVYFSAEKTGSAPVMLHLSAVRWARMFRRP